MILIIRCTSVPVLPTSVCSASLGSSPVFVVKGPSCLSSPVSYHPWLRHSSTPHLTHAELPLETPHCFINLEHSPLFSVWLTPTHPQLRCHLLQKVFHAFQTYFQCKQVQCTSLNTQNFFKECEKKKRMNGRYESRRSIDISKRGPTKGWE